MHSSDDSDLVEMIVRILKERPGCVSREILRECQKQGLSGLTKTDINSVLYRGSRTGRFVRDEEQPPGWACVDGPVSPAPVPLTDPAEVVAIFIELFNRSWSGPQREAAAQGPAVQRLTMFSPRELRAAADRQLKSGPFDWDRWFQDAVAIRSADIRL